MLVGQLGERANLGVGALPFRGLVSPPHLGRGAAVVAGVDRDDDDVVVGDQVPAQVVGQDDLLVVACREVDPVEQRGGATTAPGGAQERRVARFGSGFGAPYDVVVAGHHDNPPAQGGQERGGVGKQLLEGLEAGLVGLVGEVAAEDSGRGAAVFGDERGKAVEGAAEDLLGGLEVLARDVELVVVERLPRRDVAEVGVGGVEDPGHFDLP